MEIKTKKTVYVGFEMVGVNKSKVSIKTIDLLKSLHNEGIIENFELFVVDDQPLKDTKKVIGNVLFEVVKAKDYSEIAWNIAKPYVTFLRNISNIVSFKPQHH